MCKKQPRPSSLSAKQFRWQNEAGMKSCTDEHLELSQLFLPFHCGGFWGCQYFEATQIGSLSAIINSICSLVFLFFTLPPCQTDFLSVISNPRLTDCNIVHLCRLKKFPSINICHYKDVVCKSFFIYVFGWFFFFFGVFCLVFTLLSFASSFFPNSERLPVLWILTKKKCCIYFLIYACVTIQRFGAALLAVSSWIISWYPLGLFCVTSDSKNGFIGHTSTILFWKAI